MPAEQQALSSTQPRSCVCGGEARHEDHHLRPQLRPAGLSARLLERCRGGEVCGPALLFICTRKIEALTQVHDAIRTRNVLFHRAMGGVAGNLQKELTSMFASDHRRHAQLEPTVLEMDLAANSRWEPHTDRGGCDRAWAPSRLMATMSRAIRLTTYGMPPNSCGPARWRIARTHYPPCQTSPSRHRTESSS